MVTRLVQKSFLKGTREFEILGDTLYVRIKKPLREEKSTIGLNILDPEPVINNSVLEFYGHTGSGGPLLSLFLYKPDTEQFNAFIDTLRQRILEHNTSFGEQGAASQAEGFVGNVYDEPPEFGEFGHGRENDKRPVVNAARIEETIQLLEKYVTDDEIKPLISALKALKQDPDNEACFEQMESAFNELGIVQGAVLTYAPYLSVLLADDPFGDN